jgi:ABC-type spermidine/putrescine transport system permease subunit II
VQTNSCCLRCSIRSATIATATTVFAVGLGTGAALTIYDALRADAPLNRRLDA